MSSEIYDFKQSKEEYRKFCKETESRLPIFMQDWYLDATVADGAEWRVICIKENQDIVAVFPFQYAKIRTKYGMKLYKIENTFQMVRGGIWIDYKKYDSIGKRERHLIDIVNQVIDRLPYYDNLSVAFDLDFTDWTPLYWRGFAQTTYYTYVMEPKDYGRKEEALFNSFQKQRKKNIKRAEQLYTVDCELTGSEFYEFLNAVYAEKGKKLSYSAEQFHRLDKALEEHDASKIYRAKDKNGNTVAVSYMICDKERWYHMFGTFKQEARGAKELLSWSGMKECMKHNIIYDFEGSMIPGVSEYNRGFYVKKVPYYCIFNDSNKMKVLKSIKTIGAGFRR